MTPGASNVYRSAANRENIRPRLGSQGCLRGIVSTNIQSRRDRKQVWLGISTDEESLEKLLTGSDLAIVLLEEPFAMGHAVVVADRVRGGLVKILDHFDQTSYKMSIDDLLEYWGGEVVTRWQAQSE